MMEYFYPYLNNSEGGCRTEVGDLGANYIDYHTCLLMHSINLLDKQTGLIISPKRLLQYLKINFVNRIN